MVTMNLYRLYQARLSGYWPKMLCTDGQFHHTSNWECSFPQAMKAYSESITQPGLCFFGEDNTPGPDIYTLSGVLTGCVDASIPDKVLWGENEGCIEGTTTFGLLGLQDGTVIKGIGLIASGTYTTEGDTIYQLLFDVTPLETPLVINRGEMMQLTYTFRINSAY